MIRYDMIIIWYYTSNNDMICLINHDMIYTRYMINRMMWSIVLGLSWIHRIMWWSWHDIYLVWAIMMWYAPSWYDMTNHNIWYDRNESHHTTSSYWSCHINHGYIISYDDHDILYMINHYTMLSIRYDQSWYMIRSIMIFHDQSIYLVYDTIWTYHMIWYDIIYIITLIMSYNGHVIWYDMVSYHIISYI